MKFNILSTAMKSMSLRRAVAMSITVVMVSVAALAASAEGASAASTAYAYSEGKYGGFNTKFVAVNLNDANIEPVVMTANNNLVSTQSVASMAQANQCVAAINGTYFQAYSKDTVPYPYGTIIQNGRILHSAGQPMAGITDDGKLLVDRVTMDIRVTINGETTVAVNPVWNINHIRSESSAIVIFTSEYGAAVPMEAGAKAVLVGSDGKVTGFKETAFYVPAGGMAIVFNADDAREAAEFTVGDEVGYKVDYSTTFTNSSDWNRVKYCLGAGPTLVINGTVTASGEDEGFFEAKINTNKATRTFIGQGADGILRFGTIANATLKEAAAVAQSLGCVNAMCLDGGGSVALYYDGKSKASGRNVNNAFGIRDLSRVRYSAIGRPQSIMADGEKVELQAYNIGGNNFFKLRDVANILAGSNAEFSVGYDEGTKAVTLDKNGKYSAVGGEGTIKGSENLSVRPSRSKIYVGTEALKLTVYNIGGNNYFKLRDLGEAMDFYVGYDNATKTISIDTGKAYTD
ncbi:MAG: phosphodiester glycosidase family protein [Clostridia bacterium]|nr:phosphodiester glycosidase family protein [Clostridia bacterium]